MSTESKTYDPSQIIVTFGGVPISGFDDGTFISVAPSSDYFTKKSGADGEVARAKSNDYTDEVTITLMSSSASNDYLSGIVLLDRTSNTGVLPLQILDLNGTTLHFWPSAWIKSRPTSDFGKEITSRAWVFDTGNSMVSNVGGSIVDTVST
ncbi:MAG: DUF3277 domain-containing protein [Candidatus Hodarchaeota archaeon]